MTAPHTPAVLATLPPRKPGESLYDRTLRVSREKNAWMARALRAEARDRRRAVAARRLLAVVVAERDRLRVEMLVEASSLGAPEAKSLRRSTAGTRREVRP